MRYHQMKDYVNGDEDIVVKYRKASEPVKLHSHDYSEIVFVVKGTGVHIIGDREYPFSDGGLFFIPSDVGHMITFGTETEYYDILVNNQALGEEESILCQNGSEITAGCSEGAYTKMCEVFAMAYNEYDGEFSQSCQVLYALLSIIFVFLKRYCGTADSDKVRAQKHIALPQILDYINTHYRQPIKMYEIAQMYHYSPNYFSKFFRRNFGISFYEYVHKKRIESAMEYLKMCDNTVEEIGHAVGYSNVNEFYKMFSQYTDMTPAEYRTSKRKNRNRYDLSEPADKVNNKR